MVVCAVAGCATWPGRGRRRDTHGNEHDAMSTCRQNYLLCYVNNIFWCLPLRINGAGAIVSRSNTFGVSYTAITVQFICTMWCGGQLSMITHHSYCVRISNGAIFGLRSAIRIEIEWDWVAHTHTMQVSRLSRAHATLHNTISAHWNPRRPKTIQNVWHNENPICWRWDRRVSHLVYPQQITNRSK